MSEQSDRSRRRRSSDEPLPLHELLIEPLELASATASSTQRETTTFSLEEEARRRIDASVLLAENREQCEGLMFHALFARADGIYASGRRPANLWWYENGVLCRTKLRLSRREWIEANFFIQNKAGDIVRLKLNRAQRRLECWILRMERAGMPVRIIILKARQMGFSTYVQAVMFEKMLRGSRVKSLIVADTRERSELLLSMAQTANTEMVKPEWMRGLGIVEMKRGGRTSYAIVEDSPDAAEEWTFRMRSKAASSLVWDAPIEAALKITSAEVAAPGRGGTRTLLHLTETAYWTDATKKAAGVLGSLPKLPNSYAFNESTANGASGWFYDDFWRGWKERDVRLPNRAFQWVSLFFAWFEHEEYYWTKAWGQGKKLTDEMKKDLVDTLDETESWLLNQTYFRRWQPDDVWIEEERKSYESSRMVKVWKRKGVGQRKVGLDQIKWRRTVVQDPEIHNDLNIFRQEYPATPEEAFLSSGRTVFDHAALNKLWMGATGPIWRGEIAEPVDERGNPMRPVPSSLEYDSLHVEPQLPAEQGDEPVLPAG